LLACKPQVMQSAATNSTVARVIPSEIAEQAIAWFIGSGVERRTKPAPD
jgi:hypothetical protein